MATISKLKRKKGEAYLIRFVHPRTKKYVRRVVWCTHQEAEKIRRKIDADLALGIFGIEDGGKSGYYWSQLQQKYLRYAKNNKAEKSVERDLDVFKAFNRFLEGNDPLLSDISSTTIEKFRDTRLEQGVKPASVALELRHLRAVFNKAIRWEMEDRSPMTGVQSPKQDIVKVRYLTFVEIEKLLAAISDAGDVEFGQLVLAYLHTGARRIELLAPNLKWDDVDFVNRQILINGKGKKKRYLTMNNTLAGIFTELKDQGHECPFMFKPDYATHKIAEYYKIAGIQGANLHSLRKTFGSLLLQNKKADLYTVSRLLGHSSLKTTEKYYVDLIAENYRAPVMGLDSLLPSSK